MDLFTPDHDASDLDTQCLALARRLHDAGHTEEAESIAANLAYLREGMRNPLAQHDDTVTGIGEALRMLGYAAHSIADTLEGSFPPDAETSR